MRAFLVALLLLLPAASAAAQLAELRVEVRGETHRFQPSASDGAAAYSIDVLGLLGGTVTLRPDGARVVLLGDTVTFWTASPFFRAGERLHQLAFPVYERDGELRIPEQFFIEWLPARHAGMLAYGGGVLRGVDAAQATATATAAGARAAADADRPAAEAGAATPPRAGARAGEGRLVVIDPGHGGVDPGKVAASGLREKDVTLAIGQRLAAILRERGYEVQMTRTTDVLIPLDERPRMANRWKDGRAASLFLSIHANSADSRQAAGFETFFLAEARTEDERRVAERENAAVRFETGNEAPLDDIDYILNTLRNDFYQRASNDLAQVVQDQFADFHPGRNRGVKQAAFRVLIGAYMPAVLVEVGFLSNADEARTLGTAAFQQRLAWGIADAVDRFFAEHGHLLVTDGL